MRKDDICINEAYAKIQQLDEAGILSRAKAKAEGVLAGIGAGTQAIRGQANKIAGATQAAFGNKEAGMQRIEKGEQQIASTKNAATEAKVDSILKSHIADINKVSSAISNDLTKLGLNPANISPNAISQKLTSGLENYLKLQKPSTTTQTPPVDDSEAGEAVTPEEQKRREEYRSSAQQKMIGKKQPTPATTTQPSPEQVKGNIKANVAKSQNARAASKFSAQVDVPDNSTISDKSGTTYVFDKSENQWFIKRPNSVEYIDHPDDQKAITAAWSKKQNSPKQQPQAKPQTDKRLNPTFESFRLFWDKK